MDNNVIKELIRVDHAGEYGAQIIYSGQIRFTKDKELKKLLQKLANEEQKHLDYFSEQSLKRRVRPSLLQPLWKIGGFSLGAITAILGKDYVMATTDAVESVIVEHYKDQLKILDNFDEEELKKKIQEFLNDESEHQHTGEENIVDNNEKIKALKIFVKGITRIAIKISEKI